MVVWRSEITRKQDLEGVVMERSEIESKLTDILVDELGIDRDAITMEATFEEDLEVDSLGVVELLMALEDNFDVKIPDDEAEKIATVGQAVDVVAAKMS
jgi:acyl carrier protein